MNYRNGIGRDACARRAMLWIGAGMAAFAMTVSAAMVRDGRVPALAAVETVRVVETVEISDEIRNEMMVEAVDALVAASPEMPEHGPVVVVDEEIRWFNGRAMRPARTIRMKVTAYSPDAQSCGEYADGYTATMHPVTTNRGKLVAADPTMLAYGTPLTIPGYDEGRIVPVLDCGGAIKGNRLDVLFPTHEAALEWGVRELDVVVWAPVDGGEIDDPRKLR